MFSFKKQKLSKLENYTVDINDMRPRVSIAVIDDEDFLMGDVLRKSNYQVDEIGDIRSFSQLSTYPVVICDVKGVGKHFKSKNEGWHIIKETRNLFPEKFIIVCSGGLFGADYKYYTDLCDSSVSKDADVENWISILDKAIICTAHPAYKWKRTRLALLNRGMDIHDVSILEEAYVKSMLTKNEKYYQKAFQKIYSENSNIGVDSESLKQLAGHAIQLMVGAALA